MDPWASGGVLENISDTVVAILIEGAAHHLDIRASNPNDPPSVVKARAAEVTYIQKWIEEHYNHKAMAAYKKQKYSMFNNTGSSIKDILFNTV